jgi:hypothetical protein
MSSVKKIESREINVKKKEAIHPIGSPEQRSLARKMGSSYSPKTPPKKKGVQIVRKKKIAYFQTNFSATY